MAETENEPLLGLLHHTILALVRQDGRDLTARQLGLFLTVYMREGPHTVRGLAAELNIAKPAISRALDRLGELDLAHRKVDPTDRRSVLVQRTEAGREFLAELREAAAAAIRPAPHQPAQQRAAA